MRVTAPVVYVQMHGDHLNAGNYRTPAPPRLGRPHQQWSLQGRDVFMFFNNDIGGFAIENGLALREMIRSCDVACD